MCTPPASVHGRPFSSKTSFFKDAMVRRDDHVDVLGARREVKKKNLQSAILPIRNVKHTHWDKPERDLFFSNVCRTVKVTPSVGNRYRCGLLTPVAKNRCMTQKSSSDGCATGIPGKFLQPGFHRYTTSPV
jgi:hypothetical protein